MVGPYLSSGWLLAKLNPGKSDILPPTDYCFVLINLGGQSALGGQSVLQVCPPVS